MRDYSANDGSFLASKAITMSASAAILTKSELFDLHIRKFRSICDMHGVQCGSHEDLRDFLHKLTEDRHLAMDFWAFTGKLTSREGGELSDQQMLAVVVEGITGSSIQSADGELRGHIDELVALLAGVDVHGTLTRDAEQTPSSPTAQDLQSIPGEPPSHAAFISEAVDREASLASEEHTSELQSPVHL